jgi:UV DNA damage endonuclease
MIRLGLCCLFVDQPIRFRTLTAKALEPYPRPEQLERISTVCRSNSENLLLALHTLDRLGIGAFRIGSPLFPRYTHPRVGYTLADLPHQRRISQQLKAVRLNARDKNIRLSFHPDQFVVLSSPHREVVENSRQELEYQGLLAELVGADMINLHGGGAYGDKRAALLRLQHNFTKLSDVVRQRLTLENDDRSYTVTDLLPVCRELRIPLVYDVHHHRCNPDGLSEATATEAALATWQAVGREPHFHLSSPRAGWQREDRRPHADYIEPDDFPDCWKTLDCTIDVEAKAKEKAVLQLQADLQQRGVKLWSR